MVVGFIERVDAPAEQYVFDAIRKWSPTRKPNKSFEMGDTDGDGAVATSGASLLSMKLTIEMKTDDSYPSSGENALDKWNRLDDFIADNNDVSQTLSLTFEFDGGDKTITFTGKATKGVGSDWKEGDPDGWIFVMHFSVETKGAIV